MQWGTPIAQKDLIKCLIVEDRDIFQAGQIFGSWIFRNRIFRNSVKMRTGKVNHIILKIFIIICKILTHEYKNIHEI